jgi:predicted phage terminase large subunit-like protein
MNFTSFLRHVRGSGYVLDWFHSLLIERVLEAVARGEQDGIIATPPGAGKTALVMENFAAYLIYLDPTTHIIELANSDGLARMSSANVLRIIQSEAFQELRPLTLDKATETSFLVSGTPDLRPTLHAAGIRGQLTGHRANFILADDLFKNLSEARSATVSDGVWNAFNSCAETRLLPGGRIVVIATRWDLADVSGRLLRRAQENEDSRQFVYVSLPATNPTGNSAYVMDTAAKTTEYLPAYPSLASKPKQPFSFSEKQLRGKRADLGPILYSALYDQNPVSQEAQMFPPDCWPLVETINTDDYDMLAIGIDPATGREGGDPSHFVGIGRRRNNTLVVVDSFEVRAPFPQLLATTLAFGSRLEQNFGLTPITACEDTSSGQALLDVLASQYPGLPRLAVKAVHSKATRALTVTPYTSSRCVGLLKAAWNDQFVTDMANFPADSQRDHCPDAFVTGMRCFVGTGTDFKPSEFAYVGPGETRQLSLAGEIAAAKENNYNSRLIQDFEDGLPSFGGVDGGGNKW